MSQFAESAAWTYQIDSSWRFSATARTNSNPWVIVTAPTNGSIMLPQPGIVPVHDPQEPAAPGRAPKRAHSGKLCEDLALDLGA